MDSCDIPSPYTLRGSCIAREQGALSRDKCPGKVGVPRDHVWPEKKKEQKQMVGNCKRYPVRSEGKKKYIKGQDFKIL